MAVKPVSPKALVHTILVEISNASLEEVMYLILKVSERLLNWPAAEKAFPDTIDTAQFFFSLMPMTWQLRHE